ncbi:calcium-responsive transcription factor-like [Watersipora subatra]|uniref:calcium-responsive transcription factor-like n=1 Tax=Watersipora subatra TaxID=2589382 RepID=UPI00355AE69A
MAAEVVTTTCIGTATAMPKEVQTEEIQTTSHDDSPPLKLPKLIIYEQTASVNNKPDGYESGSEDTTVLGAGQEVADSDTADLLQIGQWANSLYRSGDGRLWHIVPSSVNIAESVPADTPQWASMINDCEKVGHYFRGWVATEYDLDIVLTLHKQQTNSFWGTRQSPDGKRPSARMMWKSQYVPFDGIPFINCGSRATVMECQFGPRRRGAKSDGKESSASNFVDFKHSCPARIYVKKVRKFPEYGIPPNLKKRELKHMMDNSFNALKRAGFQDKGEDRFYLQLPTPSSHEYHGYLPDDRPVQLTKTYDVSGNSYSTTTRLAEPVAQKIREIVASGIQHITTIRKMLRKFVEKELFDTQEPPVRHHLSFFPTVSDLKNHIHTALLDIENGTLPLREASMDTLALDQDHDWTSNWATNLVPQPETVTVTLSQSNDANGHTISRVETHMSDGSTQVTGGLTPETAALLARLHPSMFPTLDGGTDAEGDRLTDLVQSVLLKTTPVEVNTNAQAQPDGSVMNSQTNLEEPPPEPEPPTEGVQLDLGLPDAAHEVAEMTLEGDVVHETCPTQLKLME